MGVFGGKREVYGILADKGNYSGVLSHRDHPVMKIRRDADFPHIEMAATTMDDKIIARAQPDQEHDPNEWLITVSFGVDAVLVVSCILGLLVFGERSTAG